MTSKKTVKKGKVAMEKKKIRILGIKGHKESSLEVDINKDIWKEIKTNIDSGKIDDNIAEIESDNKEEIITIKEFPEVLDVCRYKITKSGTKFTIECCNKSISFIDSNFNDDIALNHTNKPVILLILESPHKDEYDDDFNPIAPANGATGAEIQIKIRKVLEEIVLNHNVQLKDKTYYLIISNPVPYQTSLNYFHKQSLDGIYKTLRNKVWGALWSIKSIQDDFEKKILDYDPDLIINACTGGVKNVSINTGIGSFNLNLALTLWILCNKKWNHQLIRMYHPSINWGNNNFFIGE